MKEQPKTILILIGNGKSTLTRWFSSQFENEGNPWFITLHDGVKEIIKNADEIKRESATGFRHCIHLRTEDELKKIPLGIKRRSLIFKINY